MPGKRGRPRGTPQSPAAKERIRQARLGKTHSPETRAKISVALTPPPLPMVPLPVEIAEWWRYVYFQVRRRRWWIKNIDDAQITELAAKLAVQGPPSNPEVQKLYHIVIALVFANYRLHKRSFKMNIGLLPPDERAMRWLYLGEETEKVFGLLQKLHFKLDRFAAAALICPSPEAARKHIERCMSGPDMIENPAPHTILTAETMDWSKNRWRGLFCEYADHKAYLTEVKSKLRTVS